MPMLASVVAQGYYEGMKGFVILAVLLSGFYMVTLNIVSSELKDLENFYSNMDQISTSVANGQTPAPALHPEKVKAIIDAYTNIFQ